MTPTDVADKIAPKKPARSRKPLPAVDPAGTTSAVDALAAVSMPADLQLIDVDPATLAVRDQAREDATPDDALIASVQKWGVLQPPTVVRDPDDDRLYIVTGHRRVGAAIAAGLSTVKAILRPDPASVDAELLEQQMVENERRKGLTPGELARGYANLETLFGQTPEDIAAALGEKPERVRAGIRAARSPKVAEVLAEKPIDLEQAAVIAEFDDNPKLQKVLTEFASERPSDFGWKAEAARKEVAKEARTKELKRELKDAGAKLAPTDAYGYPKGKAKPLTSLYTDEGEQISAAAHVECPGHAGYVRGYYVDELEICYVCLDPEAHGHATRKVDREAEAERARLEAERAEERARIEANRAVRRQWIHDLVAGKVARLAGVHDYIAAALLSARDSFYEDARAPRWTLPLLDAMPEGDVSDSELTGRFNELVDSRRIQPLRLMLATALAMNEKRCERASDVDAQIRHYEQIQTWGYQLSEVDQEALDSWRAVVAQREANERDMQAELDAIDDEQLGAELDDEEGEDD